MIHGMKNWARDWAFVRLSGIWEGGGGGGGWFRVVMPMGECECGGSEIEWGWVVW